MEQNLESIRQKKVFSLEAWLLIEGKDTNSCFLGIQEQTLDPGMDWPNDVRETGTDMFQQTLSSDLQWLLNN